MDYLKVLDQVDKEINKELKATKKKQKKHKEEFGTSMFLSGYEAALVHMGYSMLSIRCGAAIKECKEVERRL